MAIVGQWAVYHTHYTHMCIALCTTICKHKPCLKRLLKTYHQHTKTRDQSTHQPQFLQGVVKVGVELRGMLHQQP